jgi:NitT/TauT family transport system permease protein
MGRAVRAGSRRLGNVQVTKAQKLPVVHGGRPVALLPPRRRRWSRDWIYPAGAVAVAIVAWDLAIRMFDIKPFILPPPLAVIEALVRDFPGLMRDSWVTLQEVLAGFALSVAVGVPLALAIVSAPLAEKAAYPLLVGSQAVPKIAIAPLFVIWFGFGIAPKVIVAFLIAFFPIVISTVLGLRSVEVEKLYLARSMGASRWQTFYKIRLPSAMPSIFGGLKLAITFAVTGAVVGEFIGADRGLGRVIIVANGNLDTAGLFAAVVMVTAMAVALFLAVEASERLVVRWHVSQRGVRRDGA